jgi:hypothetical protein
VTAVSSLMDRLLDLSKNNIQKINNDLQNMTQDTIDSSTRTPQNPGVNSFASEG